ncbi:DMT family transporter [Palleronia sp. KMU-117]|uniref:DMT family transporter n=1 Tax=Palleronia sp. KMU-117 TaxID=3434108 RepID=UPI003D72E98E
MTGTPWIGWAALTVAVAANVGANILLKHAVGLGQKPASGGGSLFTQNPPVLIAGVLLAGVLLGFYLLALRHLPVSIAYPVVTGAAMIGIAVLSSILFSEPLSLGKMVGIAGIILCTALILRS